VCKFVGWGEHLVVLLRGRVHALPMLCRMSAVPLNDSDVSCALEHSAQKAILFELNSLVASGPLPGQLTIPSVFKHSTQAQVSCKKLRSLCTTV
jgi:hypothetical protein